jgi:hypothetical protein
VDEDAGGPRRSGGSGGHDRRNQPGLRLAAQRQDGHSDRWSAPNTGDLQSLAGLQVVGATEARDAGGCGMGGFGDGERESGGGGWRKKPLLLNVIARLLIG